MTDDLAGQLADALPGWVTRDQAAAALAEDLTYPKPVRSYYRSVTDGGVTWCESRDPEEVVRMSSGENAKMENVHFERLDVVETTTGWQPWAP